MIELSHITKIFGEGEGAVEALSDVSLEIRDGEIFGIIGLSGAGKSTLVRCINLLERPTSGEVLFDGEPLSALTQKELLKKRQSIGMIFQGFNLLSQRNILKNVLFPLEIAGVPKAQALERARELLKIVGLADRENAYPAQLSGGQKQRVAIARALATNPQVLLCDEATSALDPTTTQSILELIKKINRETGVTVVIITHEMRVIEQVCDRVAVIDKSHIVELGAVKEVFTRPQSQIAKELILPKGESVPSTMGNRLLRVVFDGTSPLEPIVSSMILECHANVNIIYAHTKNIDGKIMGHMVFRLPDDDGACARIKAFLQDKGLSFEEEVLAQ